jgi:hypothetical protein
MILPFCHTILVRVCYSELPLYFVKVTKGIECIRQEFSSPIYPQHLNTFSFTFFHKFLEKLEFLKFLTLCSKKINPTFFAKVIYKGNKIP